MSLDTARCSEPVSKMTLTGWLGVPRNNVPTYKLSSLLCKSIFKVLEPPEAAAGTGYLVYYISSSTYVASASFTSGSLSP